MRKKPRLIKRHYPLPPLEQPPLLYNDLIAKFKDELIHVQKDALEKEKAKEDSVLNVMEDNEELVQYIKKRIRFKARRTLIKKWLDELREFRSYLNQEYKRTLWEPPKWLTQSRVWNRLEKGRFKDVYSYLYNESILRPYDKATKALIQRAGGECWRGGNLPADGKDKQHAILKIDLGKMSKELEMGISVLRKYPPAFVDAGILQPLPQKLPHGEIVYSIGEHRGYPTKEGGWGSKVILYLKEDKAIIEGLERMKLPR